MSVRRLRGGLELPEGLDVVPAKRSGHLRVVYRVDGRPLRTETGVPIQIALTPSDHRTRRNELARIRRAMSN